MFHFFLEVLPPLLPNCSADQDCVKSLGRHSACRDFWCACTDEAQYDAGFSKTCLLTRRAVGESCKENGDCRGVANSYCKAGSCHCDAGFVFSDDASKCLPVSTSASPACEEHRQCVILLQSPAGPTGPAVCVGGRCRCRYDHEHVNGTCVLKKERGKGCSADAECVDLEGGACVQGVCACREGFAPDVAANKCLPVLRSPGAACTEDIQCSEGLGDLGHCSAGACACVDGAALNADNKCACAAGEEPRGGRCERTAPGKQQPVKQEGGKGNQLLKSYPSFVLKLSF
ncbi:hypothetical protein ONE63_003201 [Megalurothrips usitatus]|uniref:EB domain-containing protein n=1 Tax=Megalurothrips usitatus TaxID=439358 RepID=A0AAV7XAZ9_9NEOP|nr:hypothetical protein ONE63_003201 [Megalurothrips usitatus]